MNTTAALDTLFEPTPTAFSNAAGTSTTFLFLGLSLASWVLSEVLMAPVLQPYVAVFWLAYVGAFFLFTAWYFRVSRLFESPWRSYKKAWSPMVWTLMPLHALFPTAILCLHAGFGGMLVYELVKAVVIVSVLARVMHVFQFLNQWPRWSALALTLSPLAVALVGMFVMVGLSLLAIVSVGLSALQR